MESIYSLWLVPEESTCAKYQQIITNLAIAYGTQEFKPHVTIVKNLKLNRNEIIFIAQKLSTLLKTVDTKVVSIGHSDSWYQNLYLEVLKTPSLVESHNSANQILNISSSSFLAHLSLIYGNLPQTEKQKISKELQPLDKKTIILNKLVIVEENEVWTEIYCHDLKSPSK